MATFIGTVNYVKQNNSKNSIRQKYGRV